MVAGSFLRERSYRRARKDGSPETCGAGVGDIRMNLALHTFTHTDRVIDMCLHIG